MVGKRVSHYKILEKLGEGGMGVVYKAQDTNLERTVAIKFLPRQIAANSEERERFKIEAKAAAALNHPNIATIYAIEEHDDELFIVMEFIEGRELREIVNTPLIPPQGETKGGVLPSRGELKGGILSIDDVLDYAMQIAAGLQAAHKKGVTHRDIKSANIMITEEGRVKIMDFGLAKVRGSAQLTKVGTTLGTAAYMSPEQAQGLETDHRTDIWSFGVVLHEMLTGHLPFKGDYEQAVIYSILNEEPERVGALRDDVPEGLQEMVEKALAKDADARHRNMSEVIADMKTLTGVTPKPPANEPKPSIAVLPFANMSADPEQEYFCDGMAEEIINALTRLENLHVAARTSSFYFKGEKVDIREVGDKLNVAHVLEGSVRKAGNRLRITAQLIKIADGYHLWSERYDRELTDVFEIQDEIALAIVDKLKVELLAKEKSAIQKRGTDSLEAYQFYLKGRHFLNNRPKGFFDKAKQNFLEAIALDADFALPYAGLAQLYTIIGIYEFITPESAFVEARKRVEQALRLDNDLAEAHAVVGTIKFFYDRDYKGAEQAYKHALALNTGYAYARSYYAFLLCILGRTDEALQEAQLAKNSDPLASIITALAGLICYFLRKYDKAIEECEEALEVEPTNIIGLYITGFAQTLTGRYKEAGDVLGTLVNNSERAPLFVGMLGYSYAMAENKDGAKKLIEGLQERSKKEYVSPLSLAYIYTGLKDKDRAFEWLDKAYEMNSPTLAVLNRHHIFDFLHSDKRFAVLLQKVGLET